MADPTNANGYPLGDDLRETMASALGIDVDEGWLAIALTLMEQAMTDDASPRTWSLPVEPGPEVTAVRCKCHGIRWELVYAPPVGAWAPRPDATEAELLSWGGLYRQHAPLTDVSREDQ